MSKHDISYLCRGKKKTNINQNITLTELLAATHNIRNMAAKMADK